MDFESYREQISKQTLFETQGNGQLSNNILEIAPGNVSPEGAMVNRMGLACCSLLHPVVGETLSGVFNDLVAIKPYIDGWAVKNSIEAEGQKAIKDEEEKKRGLSRLLP